MGVHRIFLSGHANACCGVQQAREIIHSRIGDFTMSDPVIEKIKNHPKYAQLKSKRNSFGWTLSILMLVVYYGYIALIAFNKAFLAQPLGAGVTTLGIPLGMGVIVFTIVITDIYVARANSEYDALTKDILKDATR